MRAGIIAEEGRGVAGGEGGGIQNSELGIQNWDDDVGAKKQEARIKKQEEWGLPRNGAKTHEDFWGMREEFWGSRQQVPAA